MSLFLYLSNIILICSTFPKLLQIPDAAVLDRMDSSLFEELIGLFELMQKDMLANILSFVTDDVKARSRPYRHDRYVPVPVF